MEAVPPFLDRAQGADPWASFAALPGNPLVWVLILSEFAVFGAFFGGFSVARALDPATFLAGQQSLNPWAGGANTLVLLTSGWFAARGAAAARDRRVSASRRWLLAAMALGAVFIAVKLLEYAGSAAAGHGLTSDGFFTLYFLITGFHLLHVVAGAAALGLVALWNSETNVETVASFWHMVDIVWLILFPLVYLLK